VTFAVLRLKISEFPASIISLYGGLWLVVFICIWFGYKHNSRYYLVFFAIQVISLIVTLFVWDTTRVFGLLTIVGVVHCIMASLEFAKQDLDTNYPKLQQMISVLLIMIIFIPKSVAWYGKIIYPKSQSYIQILISTFLQ
jgi:hypothetical protein